MKISQEIVLSDQQNLPPNRREVMKKGLGLTLGSGALGLAGLGASTSAQSETWSSAVTVELDKNSIVYPLFDIVPNFFKNYIFKTKTSPLNKTRFYVNYSQTRNYQKVQGNVYMVYAPSAFFPKVTPLSNFYFERTWDLNGRKTFNGPVTFHNVLAGSQCSDLFCTSIPYPPSDQIFGSDEFRRRLAGIDPNPFEKDILIIYDKWKTLSGTDRLNFNVDIVRGTVTTTINITNMLVRADENNSEAVTNIHLTFNASRNVTTQPGVDPVWGPETVVNVWGLSVGGYASTNTRSLARVTLPNRIGLGRQWAAGEYDPQMGAASMVKDFANYAVSFAIARGNYHASISTASGATVLAIASRIAGLYTTGDVSYDNPSPSQASEIALGMSFIGLGLILNFTGLSYMYISQMVKYNKAARDYFDNSVFSILSSPFSSNGTSIASSSTANWNNNPQNSKNFDILLYLDGVTP